MLKHGVMDKSWLNRSPITKSHSGLDQEGRSTQSLPSRYHCHCPHGHWSPPVEQWGPQLGHYQNNYHYNYQLPLPGIPKWSGTLYYCLVCANKQQHTFSEPMLCMEGSPTNSSWYLSTSCTSSGFFPTARWRSMFLYQEFLSEDWVSGPRLLPKLLHHPLKNLPVGGEPTRRWIHFDISGWALTCEPQPQALLLSVALVTPIRVT